LAVDGVRAGPLALFDGDEPGVVRQRETAGGLAALVARASEAALARASALSRARCAALSWAAVTRAAEGSLAPHGAAW
jgi:hypothetical protein